MDGYACRHFDLETAVFAHCKSLKQVTGLENIKIIEPEAFYGCTLLEELDLGEKLEKVGDAAFFMNENLKSVYLSSKVKEIGIYAFQGCNALKTIVIPGSVRTIQQHAFYECYNLTIYTAFSEKPGDWHNRFNSSSRTIFYGTELDEFNNVVSVNISDDNLLFRNALNGISAPIYNGKVFVDFVDEEGNSYSLKDLETIKGIKKLTARYSIQGGLE